MGSQVFLADGLPNQLEREARREGRKHIAVAYTSSLTGLALGEGDILVTDATPRRIEERSTTVAALLMARRKGCKLYSLPGLHAKVYILPRCVITGSANLSENTRRLYEAAVLSTDRQLRKDALSWFDVLVRRATELTQDRLKQLARIKPKRTFFGAVPNRLPTLLEALEQNHSALTQYVYGCYTPGVVLSQAKVKELSLEKDILPPTLQDKDWEWSEWPEERGLAKELDQTYRARDVIGFSVTMDKRNVIQKILSLDTFPTACFRSFPVWHRGKALRVVPELRMRASALRLTGSPWRARLCKILTAGLQSNKKLQMLVSSRKSWTLTSNELRRLYEAGLTSYRPRQTA